MQFALEEKDVAFLIMEYLKSKRYISAMCALEEETGWQVEDFGKELGFLRKLVLKGSWQNAENFLKPLEASAGEDYTKVIFALRKQQFLELLAQAEDRPELPELVKVLKGLESLCSQAEFKELCFFLTLSNIRDHADYRTWTAAKGRYDTFRAMLSILHPLYGSIPTSDSTEPDAKPWLLLLLERVAAGGAGRGLSSSSSGGNTSSSFPSAQLVALMRDLTPNDPLPLHSKPSSSKHAAPPAAMHASIDLSVAQRLPFAASTSSSSESSLPLPLHPNPALPDRDSRASSSVIPEDEDTFIPPPSQQVIRTMAWCPAPGSSLFAYGTTSRALRLGSIVGEEGEERMALELELPEYHAGSIYGIAWHPSGRVLATGSNDKSILLTQIGHGGGGGGGGITHGEPTALSGHTGTVRCVEWCDRGGSMQVLSAGAGDCALRLWDPEHKGGGCVATLSGHLDHVQALAVSASSPVVASGGKDGQVRLWDMRQQNCIRNLASGKEEVLSLHLNPSDTILAGGFADSACVLWEMRMGRMVQTLKHHQHQCRSVHYASDGRWLLTASFDGTVACVDVADGHVASVLTGHTDRVVCARTHPSQPWVLSCGVDKTVRLWA